MRISKFTSLAAFAVLAFGASSAQAASIFVNYSDDAAAAIFAAPGDQFFLNGQAGGVLLTSGIATSITTLSSSMNLTCCFWDDQLYQTTVNHTLTLNGVGGAFSQNWAVWDFFSPAMSLTTDGPVTYNLPGGKIIATMEAASGFGAANTTLLYQAPEPATIALFGAALGGLGVIRRRRNAKA